MMLTMQGIGYIKGEPKVLNNNCYSVNVSCRMSKDEWRYITVVYGEGLYKYPMQYVKEGDVIYFEIKSLRIETNADKSYISGFASNISMVRKTGTQTRHTEQKEDVFIDEVAVPSSEEGYVPF